MTNSFSSSIQRNDIDTELWVPGWDTLYRPIGMPLESFGRNISIANETYVSSFFKYISSFLPGVS